MARAQAVPRLTAGYGQPAPSRHRLLGKWTRTVSYHLPKWLSTVAAHGSSAKTGALLVSDMHGHADRSGADVNRQHRTHVSYVARFDLRQSRGQSRSEFVRGVVVVDMV